MAPPWGQNHYPEDNEIHNFGGGLPALHHHTFSFSYVRIFSEKKNCFYNFFLLYPPPQRPQGAGVLKFTKAPLVVKMHHTKFEKNWSSCDQEVENV
jgi:hypothetical protein